MLGATLWPQAAPAQVKAPLLIASPAKQIADAPISLTGSDGSGLNLVALEASAVIEDPLAFTELRLTFSNPESRVREGRFRITLPVGATISRFAMKVNGAWQEGEVVETQAARVAYEDFLHRRQDPALLEAEAGNEFSARVFPIPANGTKELIVSYSQTLTRHDEPYVLPLRGLPQLGTLSVRALVRKESAGAAASNLGGERAQTEVIQLDKKSWQPDRDLEIAHDGKAGRLGLRHDNLIAARIVPIADGGAADKVASLFVLFDTSASRALSLEEQLGQLEALLAQLGDIPVQVATFDQTASLAFDGRSKDLSELRRAALARRALGASDLEGALKFAGEQLTKRKHARVLLVSDGVATAGETAADKLRERVKALPGVERLDVLGATGIRDEALLTRLVTAGLKRDGVLLDAKRSPELLAQKLTRTTRSGLALEVEGAGWVWPKTLNGVQPGDEIVVFADLPASKPLKLKVDGKPLALSGALASVEKPLLERAWVKARIDRMIEQRDGVADSDRDLADALRTQAIELSTKFRVLSPFTSLLVLETEADYARFHIERRALADILTVDASGIALQRRADFPVKGAVEVAAKRRVDTRDDRPVLEVAQPNMRPTDGEGAAEQKLEQAPSTGFGSGSLGASGRGPGGGGNAAPRASAAAPARMRSSAGESREAFDERSFNRGAVADRAEPEQAAPASVAAARPAPPPAPMEEARREERPAAAKKSMQAPVEGELKVVLDLLRSDKKAGLARALAWRKRDAGDVLALIALGEAYEALGELENAERAYGAIIDLFPGRADLRRFAGQRLERIQSTRALALAVDTYRKAVAQRPDHPASHRLLGFALLKAGQPHAAFDAILAGVKQRYPDGRFRGVDRILREDLGLAAAAWSKAEPALAEDIAGKLTYEGGSFETAPSLRFVLNWETDANDVDFHITDGKGGHAYYSAMHLPSGGDLYADVTTGYGPECFTIRGNKRAYPYTLQAHYYSRGPMGYGMGKLEVIEHDGKGTLKFEERPFIVMQDGAFVELGTIRGNSTQLAKR
ncbi:MAG TPA: VIT domain-containing protein [Polyangiales bacterium]|nr:VIT domain-containing protein [Polyangiales bacterium]